MTILGKSVKGATYNVAVSTVTMVLGFVRSVLLMRYLGPDEFGYVSLALFFMVFLTHLTTLGLDSALVQRPSLKQETLATHLALRTLLALGVLALAWLLSPWLRSLYAEQSVVIDVLLVLLLANVLAASFSTPNAVLKRELRFGAVAVLNLMSSLAMTIGAPLMAFLGAGVWSLVFEQVVGYLVRWVGLWCFVRPWRPALGFDRGEAKSLLGFGRNVLLAHLLGITLDRFDDFWAGTALGATALGYYSRAYEIAGYPARVLATPVTHVFYSTFSALQDDKAELSRALSISSSFLVRVGFLIAVVLLTVVPEATLILLGESWLPIVPVLRLMTVYVVLDPLYVNLSYLAIGLGHPEMLVRVRVGQGILFVAAVVAFARWWGIEGIAVAADLMILAGVAALWWFGARYVRLGLLQMLGWPIVALTAAFAVGMTLSSGVQWSSLWWALISKGLAVSLVFGVVLFVAERRKLLHYGRWAFQALGDSGGLGRSGQDPGQSGPERRQIP